MATYDSARRSIAAQKGWIKRRVNKLKNNTLSWEKFEDIYGEASFEYASEYGFNYYDMYGDITETEKEPYLPPQFDEIEKETDDYYLTMYEISQERINYTLTNSAYNVYNSVSTVLEDIKSSIPLQDYKRFFTEALPEMDDYFGLHFYPWEEEEPTNNVISRMIELARPYGFDKQLVDYSNSIKVLIDKDYDAYNEFRRNRKTQRQKERRARAKRR